MLTRWRPGTRYDYLLVWGHGTCHLQPMLDMIRAHGAFRIVKIMHHVPQTVDALVFAVYSFDYAPIQHLRGKTEYLKKTPREAYFIFVENLSPDEDYFGEGAFRHLESRTLKALKEEIRDRFNPRVAGKRSEEHVIHASDNAEQTDHILRYLGYQGVELFADRHLALKAPYHLSGITSYCVRRVPLSRLVCRIVTGDRFSYQAQAVGIEETPHYRALAGDEQAYQGYLDRYLGTALTDDHTLANLLRLRDSFRYLAPPFHADYIVVREEGEGEGARFVVVDGVHRAALLKNQGVEEINVAVI